MLIASTAGASYTICDLVREGRWNMLVQYQYIQRSPLSWLHRQQLQLRPPERRQPRRCCLRRDAERWLQFSHDVSHRWPPRRVGVDALLDHLADGLQLVILELLQRRVHQLAVVLVFQILRSLWWRERTLEVQPYIIWRAEIGKFIPSCIWVYDHLDQEPSRIWSQS